jgi:hypothetical protein
MSNAPADDDRRLTKAAASFSSIDLTQVTPVSGSRTRLDSAPELARFVALNE